MCCSSLVHKTTEESELGTVAEPFYSATSGTKIGIRKNKAGFTEKVSWNQVSISQNLKLQTLKQPNR
jgi:hypothetical protein